MSSRKFEYTLHMVAHWIMYTKRKIKLKKYFQNIPVKDYIIMIYKNHVSKLIQNLSILRHILILKLNKEYNIT